MTRYPKQGKGRKWTVTELKAVPAGWSGDTLADGDGLSGEVRISSAGAISIRWKYAFRWDGKVSWFQAGTWPSVSLDDIRRARDTAQQSVAEGKNPNLQKQVARETARQELELAAVEQLRKRAENLSFGDMFEAWVKDGVVRKDGNAELRRAFTKDLLPTLGDKPVRMLTDGDLRSALRTIVARGAERTAVIAASNIRQMFNWAELRQPWRKLLAEGNPANLVEVEKLVSEDYDMDNVRTRVLAESEILELSKAFSRLEDDYSNAPAGKKAGIPRPIKKTTQHAVWICLGTLSRIGETLQAEWKHIDFDNRTWLIPKENVKGTRGKRQDLVVSLSDFSLKQFEALRSLAADSDSESRWVFPAKSAEADTHVDLKTVSKQVADRQEQFKQRSKALKNRREDNSLVLTTGAGGDWTPHDLRRTGATMMQALGVPLDVIDRCQNHVLSGSKVRRAYMHHDYAEEMRQAWADLGARLDAVLQR